jgi:UDP:flavonoid glycosyltransferase YjiC (YdhE family)
MQQKGPVSVLVAPLDWGLGHATRCIPIINQLILQGAEVIIGAQGSQKTLLKQEFPQLEFLEIPGYEIRYGRGILLKWALVLRIPGILKKIKSEHEWLNDRLRKRKIDAVISDNRFGLFHKQTYCVFITHQLYIQTGLGRAINRIAQHWNFGFINKFSVCWIPDQEGRFSVAGKLAHPDRKDKLPSVPVLYIGMLSRFRAMEKKVVKNSLLILLSGPEPQRTRFEKIILGQLADSNREAVIVRGLPASDSIIPIVGGNVNIYNHLPAEQLNELLNESDFIITRTGYSTIMDLIQLKRTAIGIPTPGQPEQEYLGRYMQEKRWMYIVSQKKFNLEMAISSFRKAVMETPEIKDAPLEKVIREFLTTIVSRKSEN